MFCHYDEACVSVIYSVLYNATFVLLSYSSNLPLLTCLLCDLCSVDLVIQLAEDEEMFDPPINSWGKTVFILRPVELSMKDTLTPGYPYHVQNKI